ncbi:type IV pilin-like G/H family protein [Limnospira sp. PMC 917.15]|uniref:type IV pilin-like G/H family protein n=1 Tax=Limnospira sp. PMC 917.15 TaxID=2981106 RepID=UPI0028E0BDEA|nr:type IV pilin-like G/H family protein [Limnospira sp. PMC 917.15]MDT9236144.1 type IV pilin-like G/H family protein [Limnospira sp. PMC 917.15]
MKTELKAKFLQHISQKKRDGGFTLIELLVVIIIIGILSAIALPSFLNQANKARQSEARTYIGSINRAQQARFMEAGGFAGEGELDKLGLGIRESTENYTYTLVSTEPKVAAVSRASTAEGAPLLDYAGLVWVGTVDGTDEGESTTLAVLCEALDVKTEASTVGPGAEVENKACPEDWRTL